MSIKTIIWMVFILVTIAVSSASDLNHSTERRIQDLFLNLAESYDAGDSVGFRRDFSDSLLKNLSLESVGQTIRDFRDSRGKIERVEIYQISEQEGRARLRFENGEEDFYLNLDQEGKINDLQFLPAAEEDGAVSESIPDSFQGSVEIINLEEISQLKELFERDREKVRLISLLSPT